MNPTLRYVLLMGLVYVPLGLFTRYFDLPFWALVCLWILMLANSIINALHFVTWLPDRDAEEQVRRWE